MYNKHQNKKKTWHNVYTYGCCILLAAGAFLLAAFLATAFPQYALIFSAGVAVIAVGGCALILYLFDKAWKKKQMGKSS